MSLNNRSVSYSNIIFWLENSELISDLINKENGIIKKEWREATKTNLINLFLGEYLKRLKDKNVDKAMLLTGIKTFIEQN